MFAIVAALALLAPSAPSEPLRGAKRVLILGDSITASGQYTAYLESYFATRWPDRGIELINLGLPSETISGRSEPSHPWPRPNVHERLERALRIKPDVVIACYGMNDGIYHPFSEDRFNGFKEGIEHLIADCKRRSIPLILVTPPPFDAEPVRAILKGPDASGYGWMTPYARYQEDVLARYAEWEKSRSGDSVTVVDAQTPILAFLAARRADPVTREFRFAGDGVHMNADGHALIASTLLNAWAARGWDDDPRLDAASLRAEGGNVKDVRAEAGGVRFTWTPKLPTPRDPDWSEAIQAEFVGDRPTLTITGLRDGRYSLVEGTRSLGVVEVKKGTATIDLRAYPELSINRRADEVGDLIRKRERILSPAWRDDVGHKRPDTEKGLPLDQAREKADPLTRQIRKLATPTPLEIALVRQS